MNLRITHLRLFKADFECMSEVGLAKVSRSQACLVTVGAVARSNRAITRN